MKSDYQNLFHKSLDVLLTGTSIELKEAKKAIRKMWNEDSKKFEKAAPIVLQYLDKFKFVENPINKTAFISGISLIYLAIADDYFIKLKNFIVENLQHSDGRIREAARKTGDWLGCSLTSRIDPFVYPEGKELTDEQKLDQKLAESQYIEFVKELEVLMNKYDDKTEGDLEYVSDMKPSVHKSLQQVWSRITDVPTYRKIIEKTMPISFEILMKRKELELDLSDLLVESKAKKYFDVDYIKQLIYEESESDDMQEIIAIFDDGDVDNLSNVLETVTDAWNYFPHKNLDGRSPAEML